MTMTRAKVLMQGIRVCLGRDKKSYPQQMQYFLEKVRDALKSGKS